MFVAFVDLVVWLIRHSIEEPKNPEHYQFKIFDSSEFRPAQRRGFATSTATQNGW